jgi:hypothetical protein
MHALLYAGNGGRGDTPFAVRRSSARSTDFLASLSRSRSRSRSGLSLSDVRRPDEPPLGELPSRGDVDVKRRSSVMASTLIRLTDLSRFSRSLSRSVRVFFSLSRRSLLPLLVLLDLSLSLDSSSLVTDKSPNVSASNESELQDRNCSLMSLEFRLMTGTRTAIG